MLSPARDRDATFLDDFVVAARKFQGYPIGRRSRQIPEGAYLRTLRKIGVRAAPSWNDGEIRFRLVAVDDRSPLQKGTATVKGLRPRQMQFFVAYVQVQKGGSFAAAPSLSPTSLRCAPCQRLHLRPAFPPYAGGSSRSDRRWCVAGPSHASRSAGFGSRRGDYARRTGSVIGRLRMRENGRMPGLPGSTACLRNALGHPSFRP